MTDTTVIDLRERGDQPARMYAYHQIKDLPQGQAMDLLSDEEPALMMRMVAVQLRNRLHWDVVEAGPPLWRVRIHHREDRHDASLMELLSYDHERLDRLFANALHKINANDVAGAAEDFRAFGIGLRRHVHAENDLLAPSFQGPRDPQGNDPTSMMLREHDQILEEVMMLEGYFEDGLPEAGEVAPFFAMLSGTLAKHEAREEQNLFPSWDVALRRADAEGAQEALIQRVQAILDGEEDDQLA
jgi:uncharacterized protein (DUF2249 family)